MRRLTCFFLPSRSFLHARLRTATLRHDADGQATLLNLLLRNYLHYSLYDQAEKLVSKSVFPEQANNNEWARYLYYTGERGARGVSGPRGAEVRKIGCTWCPGGPEARSAPWFARGFGGRRPADAPSPPHPGRIKAIQLEYSEARRTMTNALRKAPQHTAVGFKQTVSSASHARAAPSSDNAFALLPCAGAREGLLNLHYPEVASHVRLCVVLIRAHEADSAAPPVVTFRVLSFLDRF